MPEAPTVMFAAGEESGDRHAASVFRAMREQLPGLRGIGMGGHHLREAGVDVRLDSTQIAVLGLGEVLRHYGKIRRALKTMQRMVCEEKPDLLICVDYKEFNLKLAQHAQQCGVKVLFYVSPQVWAWRPGRVHKYGAAVDMMAVIFPFEVEFFERHDIPVRYVGHPLAGTVAPSVSREAAMEEFGLDPDRPVVALMPGSRANEIQRLMPVMVECARRIRERHPEAQFVLPQAASVSDEALSAYLDSSPVPVTTIKGRTYDLLQCCDAAVTASGTATLEVAMMGVPMAVTYKISPFSYAIMSRLIRIPHIGLANIVAGKEVVKEFVQKAARPEAIAEEINHILEDEAYARRIQQDLADVSARIGTESGVEKMARLAVEMLE